MKAKDYIIIGGAVALFLYWKNKNKIVGTTTTTGGASTTGGATTGGATTGGATTGGTTTGASNEPEQVFLGLPTGMDLPVLTSGTGVPTEVAIQEGGIRTTPTPAIVHAPALEIEESLVLGGIKPIVKPIIKALPVKGEVLDLEPIIVRQEPTKYLADL
jgi:hypothetical protein